MRHDSHGDIAVTLRIELPLAVETVLFARAAAEGKDVSTLVTEIVIEHLSPPEFNAAKTSRRRARWQKGFAERLQVWIDLHPRTGFPVDDSCESIYAGRGE